MMHSFTCTDCARTIQKARGRRCKDEVFRCARCQVKKRYWSTRDSRLAAAAAYYTANRVSQLEYKRAYYSAHKSKYIEWRQRRQEEIRAYERNRYSQDMTFKLGKILRSRLNEAVKRQRGVSIEILLGCSIAELKLYIESHFPLYPQMNWSNYGTAWHIDHFLPLSSFDLSDPTQLQEACHYTNLQPLWARENLQKNRRLPIL